MTSKVLTGRDLVQAICAHFGLPIDQVHAGYSIETGRNEQVSVTLTISLTPDDLAGIARHAGAADSEHSGESFLDYLDRTDKLAAAAVVAAAARKEVVRIADAIIKNSETLPANSAERVRDLEAKIKASTDLDEIKTLITQIAEAIQGFRYEVAKNTKRSPSCSGQEGPRSGHFIDGHGIKHTNLGGQG